MYPLLFIKYINKWQANNIKTYRPCRLMIISVPRLKNLYQRLVPTSESETAPCRKVEKTLQSWLSSATPELLSDDEVSGYQVELSVPVSDECASTSPEEEQDDKEVGNVKWLVLEEADDIASKHGLFAELLKSWTLCPASWMTKRFLNAIVCSLSAQKNHFSLANIYIWIGKQDRVRT